jgi:predicted phosphoadenosine phosphosulfate sulfurtransferase
MTLRELLFKKGVIVDLKQVNVCCPFHADKNPSATLYTNSMKCWSKCQQVYHLNDFLGLYGKDAFGLEMASEPLPDPEEESNGKVVMFFGPAD